MATFAVLPIKSFADAKQRLAEELDPGPRRALAEAMFSDVLVALRRSRAIERTIVVTREAAAQQIAAGYGAAVLATEDRGHNPAAQEGIREALDRGADRILLVPGDCPMLDPAELDELAGNRPPGRPSVLIVPDRHGTGTNALLLDPPTAIEPSFGEDSCRRHQALAARGGADARVTPVASLALDVDTPEDLHALADALERTHGGAAHTRGMLRQLQRSRS